MTIQNSNPSLNPVNNDELTGLLNQVLTDAFKALGCAMPAKVIAFERGSGGEPPRAQVQIPINAVTTSGTIVPREPIASAPVVQLGGGGWFLSFPLQPGSGGWLIVCDRDISQYLQTGNASIPNSYRLHSYSDGFFLPDIMGGYVIDDDDSENAVLQNLDASVKISLGAEKITIVAPQIEIDGDMLITGKLTIDGRVIAETDLASGGNITAVGSITPDTPIPP
jgi:hypothetical protein